MENLLIVNQLDKRTAGEIFFKVNNALTRTTIQICSKSEIQPLELNCFIIYHFVILHFEFKQTSNVTSFLTVNLEDFLTFLGDYGLNRG